MAFQKLPQVNAGSVAASLGALNQSLANIQKANEVTPDLLEQFVTKRRASDLEAAQEALRLGNKIPTDSLFGIDEGEIQKFKAGEQTYDLAQLAENRAQDTFDYKKDILRPRETTVFDQQNTKFDQSVEEYNRLKELNKILDPEKVKKIQNTNKLFDQTYIEKELQNAESALKRKAAAELRPITQQEAELKNKDLKTTIQGKELDQSQKGELHALTVQNKTIDLEIAEETAPFTISQAETDASKSRTDSIASKRNLKYKRLAEQRAKSSHSKRMAQIDAQMKNARTEAEYKKLDRERQVMLDQRNDTEYQNNAINREVARMKSETTKQELKDAGEVRVAKINLFNVLNNSKSTDKQKQDAILNYDQETGSFAVDPKTQNLIAQQRLKLTDKHFNTLRQNKVTSNNFLKLVNFGLSDAATPYTEKDIQSMSLDEFTSQRRIDLEDGLTEEFMTTLGLSRSQANKQAKTLIAKDKNLAVRFKAKAQLIETSLKMQGIVSDTVVKEYQMDMDELTNLNKEPMLYVSKRVSKKLANRHGKNYDAEDQQQLETLVGNTTESIRNGLNFENLTPSDRTNVNLALLKYMDSIQYFPGTFDELNNFEIKGKEVNGMSIAEHLQGLQQTFKPSSKIGKSLRIAMGEAPPRTSDTNTSVDPTYTEGAFGSTVVSEVDLDTKNEILKEYGSSNNNVEFSPSEQKAVDKIIEKNNKKKDIQKSIAAFKKALSATNN
jgi:hypothetical protein